MDQQVLQRFWELAWEELDGGDPESALARARRLLKQDPDLPEALYVAGIAESELDRPVDAKRYLERTCALDPEWPEARSALAWACFRLSEFARAMTLLREAIAADDTLPDAHFLEGLLSERRGDDAAAEAAFAKARHLDGERYPAAPRLSPEEFQASVERALDYLPQEFREALDNISVVVEPFPDLETLRDATPPHDPEILGLFAGVPLPERSLAASGELPGVIYLFQKNIERESGSSGELEREIAITLYHEIGHALGFEESEMPELGLE